MGSTVGTRNIRLYKPEQQITPKQTEFKFFFLFFLNQSACLVVKKWVIRWWIQSAFGTSEWNKSNGDNQAKYLLSVSVSHVTTVARSDFFFCQQFSYTVINIRV